MHFNSAIPKFTWMTGCPGLCPWNPSLPACSDGRVHSVERVFDRGDPPCSHAKASPSASQSHSGFHSPLWKKQTSLLIQPFAFNWKSCKLWACCAHNNRESWYYVHNWKPNNSPAGGIWLICSFMMLVKLISWTHPVLIPRDTVLLSPSYFLLLRLRHFQPQQKEDVSGTCRNDIITIWLKKIWLK